MNYKYNDIIVQYTIKKTVLGIHKEITGLITLKIKMGRSQGKRGNQERPLGIES